jgi:hypothetical protein
MRTNELQRSGRVQAREATESVLHASSRPGNLNLRQRMRYRSSGLVLVGLSAMHGFIRQAVDG